MVASSADSLVGGSVDWLEENWVDLMVAGMVALTAGQMAQPLVDNLAE